MLIGSLRLNLAYILVFGSLTLLFVVLAIGNWLESVSLISLGGYLGILSGCLAIYSGFAIWLNEVFGRTVFPVGSRGEQR